MRSRVAIEESFGIAPLHSWEGSKLQMNGVGVGHGGHGLDGLLGEIAERAATNLERSAAGLHALEVEDVVDEADIEWSVLVTAMRRRFCALASTSPMTPEESRPRAPRMLVSGVRNS